MTTANKLTISRFVLIPIMLVIIYIEPLKAEIGFFNLTIGGFIFACLFILGTLTDFLDGQIARRYNQITTFGKFLDPIADKVLVITAMLYLMVTMTSRVPVWAVAIVITREFIVTTIRLMAVEKGDVIAASIYGKIKTAVTMVALIILLFNDFGLTHWIGDIVFYIAILMTIVSGVDYFIKNRHIIFKSM